MKPVILGLAILTMLWCSAAQATTIFTLGNVPQPNEENILLADGIGSIVFGESNQTHFTVAFLSTTDILIASGGQARIEAQDGLINNITIGLDGVGTFEDLIINPKCPPGSANCGAVTLTAQLDEPGGGTSTSTFSYPLTNGENFLTITTGGGERLVSVSLDDTEGFQDLLQPRISGPTGAGNPVPEPSTMLLLTSGLIGLVGFARRKLKE